MYYNQMLAFLFLFFSLSPRSGLNGIQTLVPLILVPAIGQQTEHSDTLQVAVCPKPDQTEEKHTATPVQLLWQHKHFILEQRQDVAG